MYPAALQAEIDWKINSSDRSFWYDEGCLEHQGRSSVTDLRRTGHLGCRPTTHAPQNHLRQPPAQKAQSSRLFGSSTCRIVWVNDCASGGTDHVVAPDRVVDADDHIPQHALGRMQRVPLLHLLHNIRTYVMKNHEFPSKNHEKF